MLFIPHIWYGSVLQSNIYVFLVVSVQISLLKEIDSSGLKTEINSPLSFYVCGRFED
jgi:hypothetical protein